MLVTSPPVAGNINWHLIHRSHTQDSRDQQNRTKNTMNTMCNRAAPNCWNLHEQILIFDGRNDRLYNASVTSFQRPPSHVSSTLTLTEIFNECMQAISTQCLTDTMDSACIFVHCQAPAATIVRPPQNEVSTLQKRTRFQTLVYTDHTKTSSSSAFLPPAV